MSAAYSPQQQYTPTFSPQQQPYGAVATSPQQYPVQYSQPQSYFSGQYGQGNPAGRPQSPPPETPAALEFADVNQQVASQAMQKLLSYELRHAGFESAQLSALQRLENDVVAFTSRIYNLAHEYANLANRARPIVTDLMKACNEVGLQSNDLHKVEVAARKRKREDSAPLDIVPELVPPPSRSPSPELLSSDDEDTPQTIPASLRAHPYYLPPLPPKHTYLRTPITPPKKAALPSLEKKLKTSGLVQESLKNLLLATEENHEDNGDGEILGAVVNYEINNYKRKRWKVGGV